MSSDSANAADYLRNAQFSSSSSSSSPSTSASPDVPTASDVLAGVGGGSAFDPSRLHPLAGITDKLEYLTLEDEKMNELPGARTALPSRGWGDDLCYGTGTTYLSGLALGGVWGLREGLGRPLAIPSARLRLNAVLNAVTRRASWMGNSAGVLALVYNGLNSSIDYARGKHDMWGSMAAGGLSGALYKCTAGVRPMLAAATLMTGAAATWSYIKRSI